MKNTRKTNNTYYIFVEGETEQWYFEHLKKLINTCEYRTHNFDFIPRKETSPLNAVKTITSLFDMPCFQIFDYEGTTDYDTTHFSNVLDEYKTVRKEYPTYRLGYSNLTFELWLLLHRKKIGQHFANKKSYLKEINKVFHKSFSSLAEYKKEKNFKSLLDGYINIEDVEIAVANAKALRLIKEESGVKRYEMGKFKYYKDNPDCTIFECVEKILKDCGITK